MVIKAYGSWSVFLSLSLFRDASVVCWLMLTIAGCIYFSFHDGTNSSRMRATQQSMPCSTLHAHQYTIQHRWRIIVRTMHTAGDGWQGWKASVRSLRVFVERAPSPTVAWCLVRGGKKLPCGVAMRRRLGIHALPQRVSCLRRSGFCFCLCFMLPARDAATFFAPRGCI